MNSWDKYFLRMLNCVAIKSKDPSRKIGAIVVGASNQIIITGYNGFPISVDDTDPLRYERPAKYIYTCHAEANCIALSSRKGVPLEGTRIYSSLYPCSECAKLIIQAGIKSIITYKLSDDEVSTNYHFDASKIMFDEAGIIVTEYDPHEPTA